jgi:hypothetical protein
MTAPESHRPSPTRRTTALGVGVLAACAVACSLPLLLGAGVLASGAAFVAGSGGLALGFLAVVGLGTGTAVVVRRRRAGTPQGGAGPCGCGGACATTAAR